MSLDLIVVIIKPLDTKEYLKRLTTSYYVRKMEFLVISKMACECLKTFVENNVFIEECNVCNISCGVPQSSIFGLKPFLQ